MRRLWQRRDDHRPRRPGGPLPVPAPRPGLRRGHPARHHGVRAEHAGARRPGLRPGRAAHVLHRRDARALRPHGEGRGRAGRPRPGDGRGVVVPRHDRRPPARARAAEEDRRAHGHLPAGVRRPDGRRRTAGIPRCSSRFRADPFVAGFRGALDDKATTEELEHVATLIPDEWLAPAAIGSPEQCAAKVQGQFDLGADGVILHGAAPAELEPSSRQSVTSEQRRAMTTERAPDPRRDRGAERRVLVPRRPPERRGRRRPVLRGRRVLGAPRAQRGPGRHRRVVRAARRPRARGSRATCTATSA